MTYTILAINEFRQTILITLPELFDLITTPIFFINNLEDISSLNEQFSNLNSANSAIEPAIEQSNANNWKRLAWYGICITAVLITAFIIVYFNSNSSGPGTFESDSDPIGFGWENGQLVRYLAYPDRTINAETGELAPFSSCFSLDPIADNLDQTPEKSFFLHVELGFKPHICLTAFILIIYLYRYYRFWFI